MSGRACLIDASAYWRIDRGAVLAGARRDHLERGLVWNCPPAEMARLNAGPASRLRFSALCRRCAQDEDSSGLLIPATTFSRWEEEIVTAVPAAVANATPESGALGNRLNPRADQFDYRAVPFSVWSFPFLVSLA